VLVGMRRLARRIDQAGEVGAKQQSAMPRAVVGEAGADEVAVEQHAPGLAVEQSDGETTLESFESDLALCEIQLVELVGQQFHVARLARSRVNDGAAEQQRSGTELEVPATGPGRVQEDVDVSVGPLPACLRRPQ